MLCDNRGIFICRDRARQLISFDGLRFNNITPTYIDGFIEYHDLCYVIMEFKLNGKEVPYGQDLAFRRLADDLERGGKPTIYIICDHNVSDYKNDIVAKNAIVRSIYHRKKLRDSFKDNERYTVGQIVEMFLRHVEFMNFSKRR